ncbi:hypothetical protein [Nitrospira lenta]|uniref:Tetratricopeptide repeat protein n=1 Tax=Nitrospira lenta TaxID=1436998 RepID=A0A330L6G4_9BACT|nr:hypothetical protein [Nitrospira lenta]SPP64762.1 conserved hypothetical protein [Nitrospira lenta]
MRADKKIPLKADKKVPSRSHKRGVIGYSKKSALLEDAITQMNAGKYGRSSAALKELLALDPANMEARRLFATLHLRLGSLLPARQAFESLANEALERQDYWLAESLLREYLAAGPRCVPFIEKLGSVYQEKGDALAASEEFAKAIDILIEDPDPDRPALPTELYAKIRELAPASPPAFRLASHFDAQTGELIARVAIAPSLTQDDALAPPMAVESSESAAPSPSTLLADPVSGVMPWDDVSADTSVLSAQSVQPDISDQFASSTVGPLESTAELPAASEAVPLAEEISAPEGASFDRVPVESSLSLSLPISSSESSSPIALQDAAPTSLSPMHEETVGAVRVSPDVEWGVASLPIPQDFVPTSSNEMTHVAEAVQSSQSDVSATVSSPISDTLAASLPCEQVQEATVASPQPDRESLSADFQSAESIVSGAQEDSPIKVMSSDESGGAQEEESSVLAGMGTTLSLATTEEYSPDVAWSAPDMAATEPASSYSPAPEPAQTISDLEEQRSDGLAESVPLPMPWEQAQESPIRVEEFTQEPIVLPEATPDSLLIQRQEVSPPDVSDQISAEAIAPSPELGSLASHDTLSAPTGDVPFSPESLAAPEPSPKIGEFSWASIFNSAWTFGSSSPAPHDSLHYSSPGEPSEFAAPAISQEAVDRPILYEEQTPAISLEVMSESVPMSASDVEPVISRMPEEQAHHASVTIPFADSAPSAPDEVLEECRVVPVELPENVVVPEEPAVAPVYTDERTDAVVSVEISESVSASVSLAEPAVSPISWDQVQDTPAPISSADIAMDSGDPLGEPPAMPVAPIDILDAAVAHDVPQVLAPVEAPAVSLDVRIEESRSLEAVPVESAEPAFRFKDSIRAEEGTPAIGEELQAHHPTVSAIPPADVPSAVSSVLADDHALVHSEEFRIVSQVEPASVAQESIELDAPVLSAAPALAPSLSSESVPPVLPQELLPVLQTLVDQLSVVTNTIPATSAESRSSERASESQEGASEATTLREPSTAPSSAELAANPSSAQMPPAEDGPLSQWKTGEVAVQTHRPSAKKRKHSIEPASEVPAVILPLDDLPAAPADSVSQADSMVIEAIETVVPTPPTVQDKEEWIRTGEAIRFIDPVVAEPVHLMPQASPVPDDESPAASAPSAAASAVDVLFQSSGRHTRIQTAERTVAPKPRPRLSAKLARVRIGLSVLIGSCFSTTRALVASIVGLGVLSVAIVAMAIGAVGLTWLVMEEKPSPAFQSLTTPPQRVMTDSGKNGYLLLLGFEAGATADPVQAGYERKSDAKDGGMAAVCYGENEGVTGANQKNASASVAQDWYRSADPAGQFKVRADSLKDWTSQANVSLGRYRQWLKMPFEDWGYGQAVTPPCAAILFAHRLHVAEGFSQGANPDAGVERLEGDMEAWRTTLSQAKTLPVKVMALQAINDDIAVASGLLGKPDFDGKTLPQITKMLRPLDPVESSMRWPMQSQLVLAAKSYESQLDTDRSEDVPLHVSVASMLPLPKQRRFNDYAEYYESSYKAAGEGRYGAMPKRSAYIKHPATGVMDYVTNPIENIIGIDPLPAWDHYNGLVIDTDAHLRLASLQAWLRRGPQDADLLARIAKAGQRFYDPYTGLPMLVNLKRGVMYSVGHDGKDQDADPQQDVVVSIPSNQPAVASAKTAPKSK